MTDARVEHVHHSPNGCAGLAEGAIRVQGIERMRYDVGNLSSHTLFRVLYVDQSLLYRLTNISGNNAPVLVAAKASCTQATKTSRGPLIRPNIPMRPNADERGCDWGATASGLQGHKEPSYKVGRYRLKAAVDLSAFIVGEPWLKPTPSSREDDRRVAMKGICKIRGRK